ncbi:hypothetical protein RJT34_18671 [Clitoria ternatea]|uniref:Uncharacterized protein n=1 Tax=Clitoria ternatea TaxID=43366 RepID=A0AAN9PFN3_CLITE
MEMESLLPKPTHNGIKSYIRKKGYQGGMTNGKKMMKIIRLRRRPHRYWRIRTMPRLRWVIRSPLNKMLAKLKSAYMNCTMGSMNTNNIFGGKRISKARKVLKGYSIDAFEASLIYEISKAMVASHELYPM